FRVFRGPGAGVGPRRSRSFADAGPNRQVAAASPERERVPARTAPWSPSGARTPRREAAPGTDGRGTCSSSGGPT
ncbi:hypothetical protein STRIP9103_03146, partial [Streptomyces ipomoeae 91-03]